MTILTSDTPTGNVDVDTFKLPLWEYFYKPLSNRRVAVLLINHGTTARDLTVAFNEVPGVLCSVCQLRDVYLQKEIGIRKDRFTIKSVGPRDSAFYIISQAKVEDASKEK